jgi:uncharacterized protein (TIGR03067 family)
MTRRLLGITLLCCLLLWRGPAMGDQGERTANYETTVANQLRGTWVAVSLEHGGKQEAPPNGEELTFTFDGGKLIIKESRRTEEGSYTTNDTKNPMEIDLIPSKNVPKEATIKGIYRIDGDTLKLAFTRGGARPTRFDAKDDNSGVITFKRKKG